MGYLGIGWLSQGEVKFRANHEIFGVDFEDHLNIFHKKAACSKVFLTHMGGFLQTPGPLSHILLGRDSIWHSFAIGLVI